MKPTITAMHGVNYHICRHYGESKKIKDIVIEKITTLIPPSPIDNQKKQ